VGAGGVGAVGVPAFALLVALRAVQALGASAAFPAGLASLRAGRRDGRVPAAWLGALTVANNASAALGPMIASVLMRVAGWRALFPGHVPLAPTAVGLAPAPLPSAPARRHRR